MIRFFPAIFLSTLSLRRATCIIDIINNVIDNFYPRSPCGERQWIPSNSPTLCYFYPRSPCGERHCNFSQKRHLLTISIHALLAESDRRRTYQQGEKRAFLSTLSLRRATNRYGRPIDVQLVFLSTLSLRRATTHPVTILVRVVISIHALLAESDNQPDKSNKLAKHFYPRSPCGERQRYQR